MELRTASADAQPGQTGDRTHECRMDEYLRSQGFYRKKIAKDGSCLFRAVAEQVLHCQSLHTQVRAACVKYLRQNRSTYELFIEGDFEKYLLNLQDPQSWVGQVEITALAELYKHDFVIFQEPDQPPVHITENGFPYKVRLCFLNGNHYDSVYRQSFEKSAAVCQSILYELLYDRVCGVERGVLASCVRGRGRDRLDSEQCKSSEESDLEEEDFWSNEAREKTTNGMNSKQPQRGRGRGHSRGGGRGFLSTKAQKSLSPALYRNVEYDVWLRSKRLQQKRDFCMAAGMQYSVGDKCKVQLSGSNRFYSAYVQEVSPDNGPVTVFIEELGKQHTVPLLNLRLPSEEPQSWQSVSEKGKRHAAHNENTFSEWDSRGGQKSSKSVPHSAPSGHVHRQHSLPLQTTADDQPSGRSMKFRKSDQFSSPVYIVPEEEQESVLLELLHKDENNFPSLGASTQTATAEVTKRGEGGEKRSSRKKQQKEYLSETDLKAAPQKLVQKQKSNVEKKHGRRVSEEPEQRSSPPTKEKSTPATPLTSAVAASSATKTAPAPSHAVSATAPSVAQYAPKAIKMTPVEPQTGLAQSSDTNQLTPVKIHTPSHAIPVATAVSVTTPAPASKPTRPSAVTAPVPTTALPKPVLPPGSSQPTQGPFQTTPVTSAALARVTPVIPPTTVEETTPAPSVSAPNAPVEAMPPIQTALPSISAPPFVPASVIPVSTTTTAPVQVTAPIVDAPDLFSATLPANVGSAQSCVQSTVDLPIALMQTPLAHPTSISPSSGPTHAPPLATPQSSLNASVSCTSESLAISASGVPPVPEHLSQPTQLPYPHLQWSRFLQDPLYPGFPQNEKGEMETLPPFSLSRKGEDLPQDINVLRFFFNLGVKAYSQQMWPPMAYLVPLYQAYQVHLRGPPSSNPPTYPSVTSLQPDNPSPLQNLCSTPDSLLDNQSHTPLTGEVGSGPVGPVEVEGYDHPPSIPVQRPPRPAMPWSMPHPNTYPGPYPVPPTVSPEQFSAPPYLTSGNHMYPSSSVGFPPPPAPHEALNHSPPGGMGVLQSVPSPLERGQENGKRSMTPQFWSLQKTPCFPGGQPHLGVGDFKPVDVTVTMTEPPPFGGPCSVLPFPMGPVQGDIAGVTPLPNGIFGRQGEVFQKSVLRRPIADEPGRLIPTYSPHDKLSFGEMEFANVDLNVAQSFCGQSYRSEGRRGQDDRGGYRGRGHRGRKDYAGRGRKDNQSSYSGGHYGRRGVGPRVGSQSTF
ncbi:OTU domain-containing protein 4-like [Myxocyprinus asiaticus]|uniref:OTU domain-containing protein 4-like n=1 Tax=Myxocyprinus asiaticus TaxID=70543 RepID=UPI002223D98D|nr:OTU domain-containing protein 4-like [Myxocyprinus asiaticus]